MKSIQKLLILTVAFYTSASLTAPITSQKANQMIQNLKGQTAQLAAVQVQPILSEISVMDVASLKNNVAKDMQAIRNDLKKIVALLQTLSTNQQEILSNLQ